MLVQADVVAVADLGALYTLLAELESAPLACIVRGGVYEDVGDQWVQRLSRDRKDVDAAFFETPRTWLAVDVDETIEPFTPEDVRGCVERWRATLPDGLRTAAMIWQCSAKAHISPNVRGRAWFWLNAPAHDVPLRTWAKLNGFDRALYTPVAPHYTAAPIFDDGADPLAGNRLHWFDGDLAHVDLDAAVADREGPARGEYTTPAPDGFVDHLIGVLSEPWSEEGHQTWALQAIGWMLGHGVTRDELREVVAALPAEDETREEKYADMVERAEPLAGPGPDVRTWLGDRLIAVESVLRTHPNYLGRMKSLGSLGLRAMGYEAPPATVQGPDDPPPHPLGKVVDLNAPARPLRYRWGTLAPGKISLVAGAPGAGKGPFCNYLSVCVAAGLPMLGVDVDPCNVLVLDFETGLLAHKRIRRICEGLGVDVPQNLEFIEADPMRVLDEYWSEELAKQVERDSVGLLVLDSYTSAMISTGIDSNKPEFATLAIRLAMISRDLDVTVVCVAHSRKVEGRAPVLADVAGSFALAALAQSVIVLYKPDEEGDPYTIRASCARAPEESFSPYHMRWLGKGDEPLTLDLVPEKTDTDKPAKGRTSPAQLDAEKRITLAIETMWMALTTQAPSWIPTKELVQLSGEKPSLANQALARLYRSGTIEQAHGACRKKPGVKA